MVALHNCAIVSFRVLSGKRINSPVPLPPAARWSRDLGPCRDREESATVAAGVKLKYTRRVSLPTTPSVSVTVSFPGFSPSFNGQADKERGMTAVLRMVRLWFVILPTWGTNLGHVTRCHPTLAGPPLLGIKQGQSYFTHNKLPRPPPPSVVEPARELGVAAPETHTFSTCATNPHSSTKIYSPARNDAVVLLRQKKLAGLKKNTRTHTHSRNARVCLSAQQTGTTPLSLFTPSALRSLSRGGRESQHGQAG